MIICPTCGKLAETESLKPMPHAESLPGCPKCRARVLAVGCHDRAFKAEHQPAFNEALKREMAV